MTTETRSDILSLDAMSAAFDKAMSECPDAVSEFDCAVADYRIRLRLVGRKLAEEITPPISHLLVEANGAKPDLSLDLWDQAETGVTGQPGGKHDAEKAFSVLTASSKGRFVAEERADRMSWLDRQTGISVGYISSADELYVDERARPFQRLFSVWFNDRDIQLIHSGLVSWGGRGVLFVGMGGAGKSTSSIACLCDGFGYLGDDFVGLQETPDGSFKGHGLFASCLLTPGHMTRFPMLTPHAAAAFHPHEDKSVVHLSGPFPEQMERQIGIDVIVLPRVVSSERTSFRPASKGEALLALAPSSVMFLPGAKPKSLDKLSRMIERVPCFWLELGRDVGQIPDTVRHLVDAAEPQ